MPTRKNIPHLSTSKKLIQRNLPTAVGTKAQISSGINTDSIEQIVNRTPSFVGMIE